MTNATHDSTFTDRRRHQAAVRTKEGGTRKKLMVLLLAGCALILSQGFRTVASGDQDEIPLRGSPETGLGKKHELGDSWRILPQ